MATATKSRPAARAAAPAAPKPVVTATPPVMPSEQQPARMVVQPPPGRAVAIGRDGRPIWRQAPQNGADPFAAALELAPPGWVYEWKRYSVMGQVDHTYLAQLQRIGKWTFVQAETHDGVFLPPGVTGNIIVDGLALMERPVELHAEANRERDEAANAVMRRARSERGLQVPAGVTGISTQTAAAQGATFVNVTRAFASQEDKEALASIPRAPYDYGSSTID